MAYLRPSARAAQGRARRLRLGRLSQSQSSVGPLFSPSSIWGAGTDLLLAPIDPYGAYQALEAGAPIPGSSLTDVALNAATGSVTQSQKQALQKQEAAGLVQAGMDPATAAATAANDVTTVLTQNGADPSQSVLTATQAAVTGDPTWLWWVIGGSGVLGAFLLLRG